MRDVLPAHGSLFYVRVEAPDTYPNVIIKAVPSRVDWSACTEGVLMDPVVKQQKKEVQASILGRLPGSINCQRNGSQ